MTTLTDDVSNLIDLFDTLEAAVQAQPRKFLKSAVGTLDDLIPWDEPETLDQETANAIGQQLATVQHFAAQSGDTDSIAAEAAVHAAFAQIFVDHFTELSWDEAVDNLPPGEYTNGGGPKTPPPAQ